MTPNDILAIGALYALFIFIFAIAEWANKKTTRTK